MDIDQIFEQIKSNRDITNWFPDEFYDPFLMKNMTEVVDSIESHILFNSKILIFHDYDVDGITGGFILYDYLYTKTDTNTMLSNREYGYGLSDTEVDEIIEKEYDLVITVDCGISEQDMINKLQENGIEVIVTDHHEGKNDLPCLFIDPKVGKKYPYKELCGAGVAYKLVCSLEGEQVYNYIDLVAFATVADVVPLVDENRYLVHKGLDKLNKKPFPPLKALIDTVGVKDITSSDIGYQIAPIINSANRMNYDPTPMKLLKGDNPLANAYSMKDKNEQRKKLVKSAMETIEVDNDKNVIVHKGDFGRGLTGIIASRVQNKYEKPVFMVNSENYGSVRSLKPLNAVDSLNKVSRFLHSHGGHSMAAGFNLKDGCFDIFKSHLEDIAEGLEYKTREVDVVLYDLSVLTIGLWTKLQKLEPYGNGNPKPYFKVQGVVLDDYSATRSGEHLKLEVDGVEGIWFYFDREINLQKPLDIYFELGYNDYSNNIQMIVQKVEEV